MKCMCAQTRPRFILSSERVLGGMEFEPISTPREKSPLPENVPRGGSNPRRCGQRAQALPTELFRPPRRLVSVTTLQTTRRRLTVAGGSVGQVGEVGEDGDGLGRGEDAHSARAAGHGVEDGGWRVLHHPVQLQGRLWGENRWVVTNGKFVPRQSWTF